MEKRLREILNKQSTRTLANYWCELNAWGWPEDLLAWSEDPAIKIKAVESSIRRRIMSTIEYMIGMEYCMKIWREHGGTATNRIFREEWRRAYEK